jgi:protein-tyrosine phosphatase
MSGHDVGMPLPTFTDSPPVVHVLMVCMGNICRSPTAEAVLRAKLRRAGLLGRVQVDSAGTLDYHVGAPPDRRAQAHARQRGYDLSALRARQVQVDDFSRFDLILAMDDDNLDWLHAHCPGALRGRVGKLVMFARGPHDGSVPDPYSGREADFERVLDLVEDACDGLVVHLAGNLERNSRTPV